LFAVPDHETNDDPARCLTFALLWLDRLRQSSARKNIAGVRILLPENAAAPVRQDVTKVIRRWISNLRRRKSSLVPRASMEFWTFGQ
jgi:hypothetical protein